MPPLKIMVIRHAEKPVSGRAQGVRARGELDDASLTALGWQRAGALVNFFARPTAAHVARPDHLFAVRYDRDAAGSSRRSRQTLGPLAKMLGQSIDDRFGAEQEAQLVKAVLQASGSVLIAWSHENIPRIAAALGMAQSTPAQWPQDRFDAVWVFDLGARQKNFVQVPQQLLAGDSEQPIPMQPAD